MLSKGIALGTLSPGWVLYLLSSSAKRASIHLSKLPRGTHEMVLKPLDREFSTVQRPLAPKIFTIHSGSQIMAMK